MNLDILCFRPFIIDLESVNGTMVNDEKIPISRFYELKAGDGQSMSSTQCDLSLIIGAYSHQIRNVNKRVCNAS